MNLLVDAVTAIGTGQFTDRPPTRAEDLLAPRIGNGVADTA